MYNFSAFGYNSSMGAARKIKAKHYTRQILVYLLAVGVLAFAGGGPAIGMEATEKIFGTGKSSKKKHTDTFRYLRQRGFVEWRREGHDIVIALTKKGKKRAGKYQIDKLVLEKPRKWDKKWRIVVFDIPNSSTFVRNVFRRKLKELGFYALQKSIWVHPYKCEEEIALLRDFLGASANQIRVIEAIKIERDDVLRKYFGLN